MCKFRIFLFFVATLCMFLSYWGRQDNVDCGGAGIENVSRAGGNGLALAAASGFGVVMRDEGGALRMGGDRGEFRVSPLWRQKFFVQVGERA